MKKTLALALTLMFCFSSAMAGYLTGHRVSIDPGHGGNDTGALGPSTPHEKTLCLQAALELRTRLQSDGCSVAMTHSDDSNPSVSSRISTVQTHDPDLYVSMHLNAYNGSAYGTETLYRNSGDLARTFFNKMVSYLRDGYGGCATAPTRNGSTFARGAKGPDSWLVLNVSTSIPATITETLFVDNPSEHAFLCSAAGKETWVRSHLHACYTWIHDRVDSSVPSSPPPAAVTYKVTLNNQNADDAGTAAYWYIEGKSTYYSDGFCSTQLTNGNTIVVPSKNDYIFEGYFTETNGGGTMYVNKNGVNVNNIYLLSKDITLYAKWSLAPLTIDPNGGEHGGNSEPTVYTNLTTGKLALADATRNGYTFGGWLETKTLADNSTWVNVFYHNIASAEWFTTDKSAYNAGAGGADIREPLATKSINDRNRFALFNQLDFLKTGEKYEFLLEYGTKPAEFNRWKQTVNPAKTTDENSSAAAMRTKIGYEATSSNIKWNHANWYGLAQSDFPNNTFLDGYCPSGWGFAVGAYRAYEGGVPAGYYASANPFIETKNCRLWVRADADLANIATLLKESNGGQKLANDARNSAGEVFLRNGATYRAVWIPNEYTITYNSNGGSAISSQNYTIASDVVLAAAPQKENDTFVGWRVVTEEGSWNSGAIFEPSQNVGTNNFGNVTLEAVWESGVRITFTPNSVLNFATSVGGTQSQNVVISASKLTNEITLSLSGENANMFSLSANSIAQNGGTISVTYQPTTAGNHTAILTATSGDVFATLTLKGSVERILTFDSEENLQFEAVEACSSVTTVAVVAQNLSENISLTISGTNANYFSVLPNVLSKDGGSISVIYRPNSVGSHSAVLTAECEGLSATLTLSGTAKTRVLTIQPNGGIYEETSEISGYSGNVGDKVSIATPTRNGYTFGGWLETKTLADNSTWVNVFYHNIASGEWFTTNKSAYNAGAGGADIREPLATKSINDRNRFALFNQLDFLKSGEKYEFLLEYGTKLTEFNRWKQTANPAKTTDENSSAAAMQTKIGYEATSSNIKWNHANWYGLAQSDFSNNTFLDGYCPSGWGFAVGTYRPYEGGVPAGYYASANPFIETKDCRLWVRADADLANIAALLKESNSGQKLANDALSGNSEMFIRSTSTTLTAIWIKKDAQSGIESQKKAENCQLYTNSNSLYVDGVEAMKIEIFSLTGQKLRSVENCNLLSLSGLKGIYLVQILAKSGKIQTEKIVVK